jgi:hypothetical protein|eukprot:4473623-Prymnesium_polylepis.2
MLHSCPALPLPETATPKRWRWLVATTIACEDELALRTARALCSLPISKLIVNFYDRCRGDNPVLGSCRVEFTTVAGNKAWFWQRVLTPEVVQNFTVVWLVDSDVAPDESRSPFELGRIENWFSRSGAMLLQPAVRPLSHGKETWWPSLRLRAGEQSGCRAQRVRLVEQMSPMFRAEAWAAFHSHVLRLAPSSVVKTDNTGVDIAWSAFFDGGLVLYDVCSECPN